MQNVHLALVWRRVFGERYPVSVFESAMRPVSAADESYARLRRLLTSGDFQPGARLPEQDLSARLGVSRTPLREALRRLQSDGLLTMTSRGVIVSDPSRQDMLALYRYRAALEGLAAELAADRMKVGEISPAQVQRLRDLRENVEQGRDAPMTASANLELHRYIAGLSGNAFVNDALSRVWDLISIASVRNIGEDSDWRDEIDDHHRQIVEAIVAGDGAGAFLAARRHVDAAGGVYASQHPDDR